MPIISFLIMIQFLGQCIATSLKTVTVTVSITTLITVKKKKKEILKGNKIRNAVDAALTFFFYSCILLDDN